MEIHLDTPNVRVATDLDLSAVVVEWNYQQWCADTYRKGLQEGLRLVNQYGLEYWVANRRHMGPISMRNEGWTFDTWLPGIRKSTLKNIVLIEAEDEFNRQVTQQFFCTPIASTIPIISVCSVEEGLAWISVKKYPEFSLV